MEFPSGSVDAFSYYPPFPAGHKPNGMNGTIHSGTVPAQRQYRNVKCRKPQIPADLPRSCIDSPACLSLRQFPALVAVLWMASRLFAADAPIDLNNRAIEMLNRGEEESAVTLPPVGLRQILRQRGAQELRDRPQQLGAGLGQTGRGYEPAVNLLDRARVLAPDSADIAQNLLLHSLQLGRGPSQSGAAFPEAETLFVRAYETAPASVAETITASRAENLVAWSRILLGRGGDRKPAGLKPL